MVEEIQKAGAYYFGAIIGFFLENGIFIRESPDYKNRPEIEGASLFESACKVNGELFRVIINVRKGVDDIAKFRYYTLKNVKFIPAQIKKP